MLKKAKKLAAMAMALVMTAGISVTASAEETQETQVQLNGENIKFTDAKPMMKKDRLYVPFRTVFENLGAEIYYDDNAKMVVAKKDDTKVEFTIGSSDISITKNDETEVVKSDAPSFQEKGHTYVPVRFAAQALGCSVGWDDYEQTAIIMDKNAILDQLTGKFTLMDKYMEYSRQFSEDNYAFKGSFTLSATSPLAEDGAIKAEGTIGGLSNKDVANMNMAVKLDTDSLKKLIANESATLENNAKVNTILTALKEIKIDIIFNATTGKYYISSPALALADLDGKAWYYFDFKELFDELGEDISFTDLMNLSKNVSFEEYMKATLDMVPMDSVDSYEGLQTTINLFKELLSDDAFTKKGDTYVSEYTFDEDSTNIGLNLKLTEKDEAITGFSIDMTAGEDDTNYITLNATQDKMNSTVDMTINMPGMATVVFDLDMSMNKTTKKPLTAPPTSSKVISFEDAFAEKMAAESELETETKDMEDVIDVEADADAETDADVKTDTKEVEKIAETPAA